MDQFVKLKVRKTIGLLEELKTKTVLEIPEMKFRETGYKEKQYVPEVDESFRTFSRHDQVHGKDAHFWFHCEIQTPDAPDQTELAIELRTGHEGEWDATNPQGLLYLNGKVAGGLDINHHFVYVKPNTHYDVLLYFYMGMIETYVDVLMNVVQIDLPVKKLYYDLKVPYDTALCFEDDAYSHIEMIKYLEKACNFLDFRKPGSPLFYRSVSEAADFLQKEFYGKRCHKDGEIIVDYVGHTHIDVAWLWTLSQTREKVQRTFSTVLNLMDRYPDYIFFSSQPQLLKYLKEEAPDLYEGIRARAAEGRFEMDGAMWLEADCNLTSGESLVRQIQHGKRFIREEFGKDTNTLWLPDVFGYSAALPQILKKSGVTSFVTSKISWNETNKMPYDTFLWQGIDGTEIFTYFLTARFYDKHAEDDNNTTYNGDTAPSMCRGTWERYQQKEYNTETIVTFGYGDGGGGPNEEMLEVEARLEAGLPGLPVAKMSTVSEFLSHVKEHFSEGCRFTGRTPRWVGELYLEKHRGTYTSMALNKRNNRKSEFLLQDTEGISALSGLLLNTDYPAELFYRNWETLLLNQFHDIIPGSSIRPVYEESAAQYAALQSEVSAVRNSCLQALSKQVSKAGLLVYNPNGFPVSGLFETPEGIMRYASDIPALGYRVIPEQHPEDDSTGIWDSEKRTLVTAHYIFEFDEAMSMTRLYDRDNLREVIPAGERMNVLRAYENQPYDYDNWEICNYYEQKYWDITDVASVTFIRNGDAYGLKIIRTYMDSEITQHLLVSDLGRRIDFRTTADWHEDHILLKTLFSADIHTDEMVSEIQYGHVSRPTHRNTSWDQAKFEVCGHKWSVLQENGYGIALLNDCKYGYSAIGNTMTLSLVKTGTHPNEIADQGHHEFTYSLLPYAGDFREAGVISESYLLNRPLLSAHASGTGTLPEQFSLVQAAERNIIIDTVKQAEDGTGIIVRFYEAGNRKTTAHFRFGLKPAEIQMTDLLENPTGLLDNREQNDLELEVGNFEIATMKLMY